MALLNRCDFVPITFSSSPGTNVGVGNLFVGHRRIPEVFGMKYEKRTAGFGVMTSIPNWIVLSYMETPGMENQRCLV